MSNVTEGDIVQGDREDVALPTASPLMAGEEVQPQNAEELAKVEPLPNYKHVGTIIIQQDEDDDRYVAWLSIGDDEEGKWVEIPETLAPQIPQVIAQVQMIALSQG